MSTDSCPFCLNQINRGATACGHCGAYIAVSQLSSARVLVSVAWLLIGLFVIFISEKYLVGILITSLSLIGALMPVSKNWVKH